MQKTYETERLLLKVLDRTYAEPVLDYFKRNREFLQEWETARDDAFYTNAGQEKQLANDLKRFREGSLLRLWIFKKDDAARIIGSVAFANIVRGAFLSCHLGYRLDALELNRGFAGEAVRRGIDTVFADYQLHRIEANIMPRNKRSLRVVEKLGFYNEGLATKYLKINGNWEDHIHMVLLNEEV
ncbi:MAG TPA: GNAT family N-acetyltransferase [Patescibacteria group bacterium]|nr:GNAT family N-acetyltransferase [Patescibacteria group bacterium]